MQKVFSSDLSQFKSAVSNLDLLHDRFSSGSIEGISTPTPYQILDFLEHDPGSKAMLGSDKLWAETEMILSEELCEMVLPLLLDGGENYLTLERLRFSALRLDWDAGETKEKLRILADSQYLHHLKTSLPAGYGFVTYPGYLLIDSKDFVARFPGNAESYFPYAYPVIYELEGLREPRKNQPIPGWLAFPLIKPSKMREQVPFVREKTREAVVAIEKLNGRLIGLGGLLASLTDGGQYLVDKTTAKVTTGHSYTIENIANTMRAAAHAVGLRLKDAVVAVVGAAGSVGSGLAQLSAREGVKEIILVDTRDLDPTIQKVRKISKVPVSAGTLDHEVGKAHIVLIATSSSSVIFDPKNFREGALVLDDSQPKNVPEHFLSSRDDILILEGGAVRPPRGHSYRIRRAFGPKLKKFHWNIVNIPMAARDEVPCCLAEAMIWSLLGEERESYSLGKADPDLATYLNTKGSRLGFEPAPLQSFGKNVPHSRIERIRQIYEASMNVQGKPGS